MSSHVVTLRNAILEARAALTSHADLTALVPVAQITYGNSPQKDVMPRIVIEASGTEYDATFMASRKVQTFTLDYAVYSNSVDECTNIMDKMRDALDIYDSSEFSIRVTDESFQAEVDGTLVGVVVATFQDADGAPGFGAGLSAINDLVTVQAALDAAQAELAAETAQWEAATGGTYEEYIALPAPEIYYLRPNHKEESESNINASAYPNGYTAKLEAGELNPAAPTRISHVAAIDYSADNLSKTLLNNNEFGNKHRFTYDDGTEATEMYASSESAYDLNATTDGYLGSNPDYIIDHYTGLGWIRARWDSTYATANNEPWHSRYLDNALGTTPEAQLAAVANATIAGYSDWRLATLQEFHFTAGGPTDTSSPFTTTAGVDTELDMYLPMLNQYARGIGAAMHLLGPVDSTLGTTAAVSWPYFKTNSSQGLLTQAQYEERADGSISWSGNVQLVRRHY